ncbi:MAG: MotA/TolQ/ExbB proton channel family protein [Verrucomicrobia bacterium]|jgi:biopolymer transport protein ExbB|nr:MotA/TolQ/ExbB proton channel family protein [Verrucomicrobiota bacterium]MBO4796000.1 MotA/TolQ/ExbB proton channel family protein [Verrucomicrobiota bacterium]MBR6464300.1 MotA/TolQ/ExbB proton channel family protein [Verrucomicrobiota bacterium]
MLHIFFNNGGTIMWVLLVLGALGAAIFIERLLHYHRAQIDSKEFITGVKNVLRRENQMEALSICDATPGPVARLVKLAILNKNLGTKSVNDAIESAGLIEVPRLETRLSWLATIAEIAQPLGCLGTVLGMIKMFRAMQLAGPFADVNVLSGGIWTALISAALGLALSVTARAGYNYLIERVNNIVLDMEKTSTDITHFLFEPSHDLNNNH